ncbi:MAG: DoxX family protein [Roseiarcus sp.]|jgi:putative oxidoreductase
MIDTRTAPYAALLLRLSLGALFLAHAGLKIFVFTPAGTAQFFGSLGLPPALAYVTIAWELIGAAALIVGVWPRVAALALVPILIGAIATVHGAAGFFFTSPNGGWEFPALWIVALVALAATGDGAFALLPTAVGSAKQASDRRYEFARE